MKLITEQVENVEYICEDVGGKKNYKIRGVFLQSEIKNRNGRGKKNFSSDLFPNMTLSYVIN